MGKNLQLAPGFRFVGALGPTNVRYGARGTKFLARQHRNFALLTTLTSDMGQRTNPLPREKAAWLLAVSLEGSIGLVLLHELTFCILAIGEQGRRAPCVRPEQRASKAMTNKPKAPRGQYIGSCAFSTPRQPLPFSLGPAPLARRRSPVARGVPTS